MIKNKVRAGFTIVELIVVIAVIAILASVVLASYGSWRTSVATNSLKSDLEHAASAMESSRTFNNAYPVTLPTTFSPSANNTVILTSPDTKSFCLDGTTTQSGSIKYYIDNLTQVSGATSGTCAARTTLPVPGSVANVTFTTGSVNITVSWALASPNYATQYLVQCSLDPGFITGLLQVTANGATVTSATLNGANAVTTYYCRVRAANTNGQSDWSNTNSGDTQAHGCADTNQYGTFPNCYDYDSIPVGSSIAGFWSSPPDGYLLEDGSAVSRTTYSDLFALIGATYGAGDGSTTFNLPDSRGRATVNLSNTDTEFNVIGKKYGEKTHQLTIAEMPSHNHQQYVTANSGGSAIRNDWTRDGNGGSYYQGVGTSANGSNVPHNVIQPSIVKEYAIKYRVPTGNNSTTAPGTTLQGYWSSAPVGYLAEDGSAVSRTAYPDLFAAIGITYGAGNGSTTFNLPDSRGRVGVNRNPSDTQFATLGLKYGEKTHLLTIAEMASHNHQEIITASTSAGPGIRTDYSSDAAGGTYDQGIQTGSQGGNQAHNVIQPSIVKLSVIKASASVGSNDDVGMTTGSTIEGWWSSAPSGYLLEDGSAVSRTTYSGLFALTGTTYGAGDGSTTFNLPDSRGRVAVNLSSLDAEFNVIGKKYGEKTHVNTVAELPSHSHDQYVSANSGGSSIRIDYKADASSVTYSQNQATGATGGNQAHNVIQPSITKYFAIKY
jgi:prepilin-type N-terminal cleavage/methylation domain-containing protein